MAKAGTFKAAYLKSSLFEGIDREKLYHEQKYVWDNAKFEHYRYFSAMPNFSGEYISTNENGFRKTIQYTKKKNLPEIHIAIFGTSTIWGGPSGGDANTIPSLLSKNLNNKNHDLNFIVKNYAVGAYTNTQEMMLFFELLEKEKIDIALFVDGASEFLKSYDELVSDKPQQGFLQPDIRYFQFGVLNSGLLPKYATYFLRFKRSKLGRLLRSFQDKYISGGRSNQKPTNIQHLKTKNKTQVKRTQSLYLKNKKIIEAVSEKFGVTPIFILEPWIYTKKQLSEEEEEIIRFNAENTILSNHIISCIKAFSESFKKHKNCFDFTPIMNKTKQTIFVDAHHMSKGGNMLIAEEMYNVIIDLVAEKTKGKS
jgi:hypothetical protein